MMKPVLLTVLALTLTTGTGGAQMMSDNPENGGDQPRQARKSSRNYPAMMHPGMMGGHGYGMGPGQMGGYGYGMGPGMMGGYSHGMWSCGPGNYYGYGDESGQVSPEEYQKFLDETKELRKKLHDLRFEYGEVIRNPKTTMADKNKMEQELLELQQQIQEQAQE